MAAFRITGDDLAERRFLIVGAGSANTGTADLLVRALINEGLTQTEARRRCWFFDREGLITTGRDDVAPYSRQFAHEAESTASLVEAIRRLKPAALAEVNRRPNRVTDEMFLAAATAVADGVSEKRLASGSVFPELANIRDVSVRIAAALGRLALEAEASTEDRPQDFESFVRTRMYDPVYSPAE